MTIPEADEARRTAEEIVSRSEFREEQPTLVQRAIDWFFRQLGELFGGVVGGGGGYVIGYLILAVALTLAAYFVWRFFPRRRLASRDDGYRVDSETIVRRSRSEWLEEAEEAEAEQAWDRAVHARYHALTTGLADAEELPATPSTTSGEHRSAFAAAGTPARSGLFDSATDRYEQVWFGGDPAEPPDSQRLAATDRELLEDER